MIKELFIHRINSHAQLLQLFRHSRWNGQKNKIHVDACYALCHSLYAICQTYTTLHECFGRAYSQFVHNLNRISSIWVSNTACIWKDKTAWIIAVGMTKTSLCDWENWQEYHFEYLFCLKRENNRTTTTEIVNCSSLLVRWNQHNEVYLLLIM